MEEDTLKEYADSMGVSGQAYEAVRSGNFEDLIRGMFSKMDSDPLLSVVMRLMFPENGAVSGITGRGDEDGHSAAARATVRRVAQMLGACQTCCGEEESCPECHGSGKPGSVPSIASAEEFRAWIGPALSRMEMQITNQAMSDASPR